MKTGFPSFLLIVGGALAIALGANGLFTSPLIAEAPPTGSPPDPQLETIEEFTPEEVEGFLPYLQPAGDSVAPALDISTSIPVQIIPPDGSRQSAAPTVEEPHLTLPANVIPRRIEIKKINLDAPIVLAGMRVVKSQTEKYTQWLAPDTFAAGWHADSAPLGMPGNTVLNGHHNIFGEVFKGLIDLDNGDFIHIYGDDWLVVYNIANKVILPERYVSIEARLENAQWIAPSNDERLTLITCYPYTSNTHRLILVAVPVARAYLGEMTQLNQWH